MKILPLYLLYAAGFSLTLTRRGFRAGATPIIRETGKPPERILIVGATGGIGRELVRQALERGYSVTAFVRNPARLPIQHPQLTVKQGDALDYASVEAAVRDQDAVVSALGHKRFFYPNLIPFASSSEMKLSILRVECPIVQICLAILVLLTAKDR